MKQHTGCFLRKTPKTKTWLVAVLLLKMFIIIYLNIGEPEVTPGESIDINTPLPINSVDSASS